MDTYITGGTIKRIRESKNITQADLAKTLGVSDKAVSKWETGKGFPDISLLEPLAKALNVSVTELISGNQVINKNVSANMLKTNIYVCPICGNIIHSCGEAVISCCGIELPPLLGEEFDELHQISLEKVEDEYFISLNHDMTKSHYISFIAYANCDTFQIKKLYPEGNAEARIKIRGRGFIYAYCNKHGLFKIRV